MNMKTINITIALMVLSLSIQAELRLINFSVTGISFPTDISGTSLDGSTISGTIELPGTINNPLPNICLGSLETETTGTAGPFQLELFALDADDPLKVLMAWMEFIQQVISVNKILMFM